MRNVWKKTLGTITGMTLLTTAVVGLVDGQIPDPTRPCSTEPDWEYCGQAECTESLQNEVHCELGQNVTFYLQECYGGPGDSPSGCVPH